jgi:hypothetical protein
MDKLWSTIEISNKSLFRFEGLQDYSAEDGQDKVQHFLNTGLLLEYPGTSDWWKEMKKRNDIGIITKRVRLVVEPVTDYTKWELAYLKEAKKYSGDDIKLPKKETWRCVSKITLKGLVDTEVIIMIMFKNYLDYIRNNPNQYWFKRKVYGWGWVPATWQGWFVTLLYILLISIFVFTREEAVSGNPDSGSNFLVLGLPIIVLTTIFIFIAYKKGEKPKWQWGLPKDK